MKFLCWTIVLKKKTPPFRISFKPSKFARLLWNGETQNHGNLIKFSRMSFIWFIFQEIINPSIFFLSRTFSIYGDFALLRPFHLWALSLIWANPHLLYISSKKLFKFFPSFFYLPLFFSLSAIALKVDPRKILKFMRSSTV